jgi:inosine/xanthosine triphosphate pyrophosphatase family protein
MPRVRAIFASQNQHKLRELRALFPDWDIEALEDGAMPEETGSTFYENALAKARHGRDAGGPELWVIGEDSGLEVEELGGRPGIRSARYAGPEASDEARERWRDGSAGSRAARQDSATTLSSSPRARHEPSLSWVTIGSASTVTERVRPVPCGKR